MTKQLKLIWLSSFVIMCHMLYIWGCVLEDELAELYIPWLLYTYNFSKDIIFMDFAVALLSATFSSLKINDYQG